MKRSYSIEFLLIAIIGFIYFAFYAPTAPSANTFLPALDLRPITNLLFDSSVRITGIEHERLAGVILPIHVGLQRYGHIPFWNSFLSNGVPLINNAFNYLFNPFHSLPVLIWGGVTGSKIAILIALLIAGYSMWAFALAIGLGAVARVTTALLYMLNGSIAAKFGAGHFQLACSLAWPPLVMAALWWTLHTPKRRAPIAFGISFALLFYAGNIYYTLHTVICCIVIVALHLVKRNQGHWYFRFDGLRRTLIAALFAFGLAALQFFPIWQTRDYVTHEQQAINADGTLASNYDLIQSFNNLTVAWRDWQPNHSPNMIEAVDYAYIGSIVFVLIGLAFFLQFLRWGLHSQKVLQNNQYKTVIAAALILALVMMLWAGGQTQPIPWLYTHIPLLAQFRFLGRALAIADLWWIVLSGIALDMLWNWLREMDASHSLINASSRRWLVGLSFGAFITWLFMLLYSASTTPDRIAMVMRNVTWWQQLDPLRYTSLSDALRGLLNLLISIAIVDTLLRLGQDLLHAYRSKQRVLLSSWIIRASQIALLAGTAYGIFNVMIANTPALPFTTGNIPFDTIYDDIRREDTTAPFPSVSIPYSPYTFGAYEHEIRVWSLNEGWLPAASPHPMLNMNVFFNPPRWLIAEHNANGTLRADNVRELIQSTGYELRGCYIRDGIMKLADCSLRKAGLNLYEYPQALPYAFIVSDSLLVNNPANLNASRVQPADVLLYQQDNIIIHTATAWTDFDKHYLVVQEANFPGWLITRDGEPVQPVTVPTAIIGQQTLGLIAIPLEQGNHTYTLRFEPPGLSTGILVFCGTIVLILVYLKFTPKQKSPA